MSQAKDKLVQSKEEVIKQIEQYAPDIRHKLRLGKSPFEIKAWLNERGVYAPHYFLMEQIEKFKITSTGKPDFKEGKAIIKKDEERYKECSKCKELKPFSAFGKHKNTKDGYQYWCKDCTNNYGKDPEVTLEEKQIIIDKERFTKIRELILSKEDKYIRAQEIKPIIPNLRLGTIYKILASFEEEGLIVSGTDPKDKRKNIYWLPEEPFEDNISSDKQLEENKEEILDEHRAPSEIKQPDFKDQLESKKIDLYKMFAAGIPIPEIKKWLNEWDIYPPYDALIEFQEEHKSSIESLEKMYKTGISGLKEDIYGFLGVKEALWENRRTYDELVADNKRLLKDREYLENKFKELQKSPNSQKLYIPYINELSEIFNLPTADILINCHDKDSFLWICKTLNDHSIDFEMIVDSQKSKYGIVIVGEEAE